MHCRDTISIKQQTGFVTQYPDGEHFSPSAGILNDNFAKVNLLQTPDQKEMAMRALFDKTVSVSGTKDDGIARWQKAWDDAFIYFDKAFGLEPVQAKPIDNETNTNLIKKAKDSYTGKLDDLF